MTEQDNARALAAGAVERVSVGGESLSAVLIDLAPRSISPKDRAFVQALAFEVCRWYVELDFLLRRLASRPVKDSFVRSLALVGLCQLRHMRVQPHAAVSETVAAAKRTPWAKPFLNAVLRGYLREQTRLDAELGRQAEAGSAHPRWLLTALQRDWPEEWQAMVAANNRHPPMSLRVNRQRIRREDYQRQLSEAGHPARPGQHCADALLLDEACAVDTLPGFHDGIVSVQDEAPQLAAELLQVNPGDRVLDVCAAPGGKTAHLIETCPDVGEVVALELSPERARLILDNLRRGGLTATVVVGDGTRVSDWWDGRQFDRVLLDAPCSATGVIRRHPDIKLLRKASDILALATRQLDLLTAIWPTLRPGGRLLYATCSVLRDENERTIQSFMSRHADARVAPLTVDWGRPAGAGRQILVGENGMDGFFYAALCKAP
ncbi:MAG: 16S rRNA (cytosine(967)-C(5))-methyltransferase RsmB [Methylotetracoccus sp.]